MKLPEKKNLGQEIAQYMKKAILDGKWNPGDRLIETKLARELGTSQTPVREAINQLASEGVIVSLPNRGAVIRDLDAIDIFEIYSIRAVIEGLAIRLATSRATPADISEIESFYNEMKRKINDDDVKSLSHDAEQIHEFIYKLANHSELSAMHQTISFKVALANRILSFNYTKQEEFDQHRAIIEALKKGDPDYSEKVMREHIHQAYLKFVKSKKFDNHEQLDEDSWI